MQAETGATPTKVRDLRVAALARFATAITIFNILGHLVFGFEQSYAFPIFAVLTTYSVELLLETIEAWARKRPRRYSGGLKNLVVFLLPAHITGLAVSMLLYSSSHLGPIIFGAAVGIASKYIVRVTFAGRQRHVLNPSNFGITMALLVFPWVGVAMPYMFTENLSTVGDLALTLGIIGSGSFLNAAFTRKIPLIAAWLGTFVLQALVRSLAFDSPFLAGLMPMTGIAFILFTFYMVSDPSTTPMSLRGQLLFGSSVAVVYGVLLSLHIVFTIFAALTVVCLLHGVVLFVREQLRSRASAALRGAPARTPATAPAMLLQAKD